MLWHTAITHVCLLAAGASGAAIQQQPLQAGTRDPLERLKERVGARLIDVAPIAKPCYGKGAWNSSACLNVRENKGKDDWTSNQAAGYYYSNWASCQSMDQACGISSDPNPPPIPENAICHNGTVPPQMIRVDSVNTLDDDIDAAFEYVRATNVPLVIKNTGHDWKGRATAPNSLALWTHNLRAPDTEIGFDEAFTPFKCKNYTKEKVFHYGPGQTWGDAYKEAEKRGLSVLGGTCPTVGIAGWFQGGGHSPVTPLYGMGVDNLRQLEIVTPKEGKLIVNECTDPDLWFAIRGGGAGSFGIVTKITYKALEREPVVNLRYTIDPTKIKGWTRDDMAEYLDILASNAVQWSRKGWGGYIKSNEKGAQIVELAKANSRGHEVAAEMKDLFEFLDKHGVPYPILNHHSWPDYVKIVETNHPAGGSMNVATRLVPEASLVGDRKKQLVDALMNVYDNHLNFWLMLVAPTAYKGPVFKSAIHPTWRTATMLVRVMDKWDLFDDTVKATAAKSHYQTLKKNFDPIRALLPNMGTSVSESDIWEDDHISTFWGTDNYNDLLPIKERVDPENLLTNWHAVNWEAEHPRYQCYPKM